MSEFDDRLRTAMHAAGDRAQVADLLDRSLRTSRVLRRRRAVAAATTAAVVVGGIGIGGWAISTNSHRDGFSPVVTVPSSPTPTPPSPTPPAPSPSSSSPAPTPSASSPVQSTPVSPSSVASATPTALTLVALPVVECPTQYGIANPGPAGPAMSVTVPGDVAAGLANYTDGLHYMSVVGPRGWHCSALDAADGTQGLFIAPPGTSVTTDAVSYTKDLREGIGAVSGGSAQQPYWLTCNAMPDLGVTGDLPCTKVPAGEQFTRVNHTTADFVDPPGVAGIGTPSGGRYTARGQIRYSPPPIPTMGMDYTHLGRTGLSVSRLCLGTMNFGP
jgi:hypothetical protein